MQFEDLRAIPYVGAWSQMRQNIPGFYGLGSALKTLIEQGHEEELIALYDHSLFFRTLLENAMQTLSKSFFQLTHYLRNDKTLGKFWRRLYKEAELTITLLKRVSKQSQLLENAPVTQHSIIARNDIVLPLLIIQQYALMALREENHKNLDKYDIYKKIIMKSIPININANRESA